jgi:cytochrome P450
MTASEAGSSTQPTLADIQRMSPQTIENPYAFHRAFGPRRVSRMEDYIRGIAVELVDGFAGAGSVDLVPAYAVPLLLHRRRASAQGGAHRVRERSARFGSPQATTSHTFQASSYAT